MQVSFMNLTRHGSESSKHCDNLQSEQNSRGSECLYQISECIYHFVSAMKTHLKNIIEGVEERPKQRIRKLNRCSDVSTLHLPHSETYEIFFSEAI